MRLEQLNSVLTELWDTLQIDPLAVHLTRESKIELTRDILDASNHNAFRIQIDEDGRVVTGAGPMGEDDIMKISDTTVVLSTLNPASHSELPIESADRDYLLAEIPLAAVGASGVK